MRDAAVLTLLVATASIDTSCFNEPPERSVVLVEELSGPEEDIQAILAVSEGLLDSLKNRDLDALVAGFDEGAVIIPPGQPVLKGKEAIRVFYRTQFDRFQLEDIGPNLDELVVCGDWAFTRGTAVILGKPGSGDHSIQVFKRGMEIWRRQPDGSWKLARAIGNGQ